MLKTLSTFFMGCLFLLSCTEEKINQPIDEIMKKVEFNWNPENFSNIQILRYKIPGFDQLALNQKKLAYYLTQAGLSGRDITWDLNYRHNLAIRSVLDHIVRNYQGNKESEDWKNFIFYVKNVWYSNGIHHFATMAKIEPLFSKEYFDGLIKATATSLQEDAMEAMFNTQIDVKKINSNTGEDVILTSAINYYGTDITQKEVDSFYEKMIDKEDTHPISYGLNSKVIRNKEGELEEQVWKVGGMYSPAIEEIVKWLEKATSVAENSAQKKALKFLIKYYQTGNLHFWDKYNVAWVKNKDCDVDFVNGFVETYYDPMGFKGTYESIVYITDFAATAKTKIVADNAQWFENNSPTMEKHKAKNVKGIFFREASVVGGFGDLNPIIPAGMSLPNSEWISHEHGAKVLNMRNIKSVYRRNKLNEVLSEFAASEKEIERAKKYKHIGHNTYITLYGVIGHNSGRINDGVKKPQETLKNYAATLNEAQASLVSLYFSLDQKIIDLKIVDSLEPGYVFYDSFIRNELLARLRQLKFGTNFRSFHLRSKHLIAMWVFEKGARDNVIERISKDGKTYFVINDYEKLRALFGKLLKEVQRIQSEGDYKAAEKIVTNYGEKIDTALHKEVLERSSNFSARSFGGFINPSLVPIIGKDGEITNVKVEYPSDFTQQMLKYSKKYGFLVEK